MNILFITFNDISDLSNGGNQCGARNFSALQDGNQVELVQIKKRSSLGSTVSLLQGHMPPVLNQDIRLVLKVIDNKKIDCVFLDRSLFGIIAKTIKKRKRQVKIITFFHNIESDYIKAIISNKLKQTIYYQMAYKEEKLSVQYSDKIIALTRRDSDNINKLFGKKADEVIPITFADKLQEVKEISCESPDPYEHHPAGIMVSGLRNDTRENINWLLDNVAPKTPDVCYYLIGRGLEQERAAFERKNVKVIGSVDDLLPYYYYADFVVLPVIVGAGMKVKTAEAMMYGKTIFGTDEALVGYDIEDNKIGARCNSAEEFIKVINEYSNKNNNRFNEYSRQVYIEKYSTASSDIAFQRLLKG